MFYATEELWFPMAEYCPFEAVGCKPWEDQYRDRYLKNSPESFVANWKTPHLVIHGSNDFRIPISEGLSAFTALQIKGIPSRFIHFTQENHWVLRAENSVKWYEEVLGWLDKYTQNLTEKLELPLKFLEEKN
jgi:dipeptidyl aminopeptidase/acylaminoacyl peptidase